MGGSLPKSSFIHFVADAGAREGGEGADVIGSTVLCGEGERWHRCRGDEGVSTVCRWPVLVAATVGTAACPTVAPTFKLAARFAEPLSLRLVRVLVLLFTPLRPMPRSGAASTAPELQLACELPLVPELGKPGRTPPRTP